MGIIWRSTMVLLSLLAALVIIVHTEDLDTDYSRALRPRTFDTGMSRQEQSWRALEVEPKQQSTKARDDNTSHETRKRLRPVRKRRRRPQTLPGEVSILSYPEETSRQYMELDLTNLQTTDVPKRRRKNPVLDSNRWMDVPFAAERPMRRHGQRKKRPSLETWPQLSEFDEFRPDNSARKEVNIQTGSEQQGESHFDDRPIEHFVRKGLDDDDDLIELPPSTTTEAVSQDDDALEATEDRNEDTNGNSNAAEHKHDKSLSEFSIELAYPNAPPREPKEAIQKREKSKEKTLGTLSETYKAQDKFIINDKPHRFMDLSNDKAEDVEVDEFKSFKKTIEGMKGQEKISGPIHIHNFLEETSQSVNRAKKCKEKSRQKYKRFILEDTAYSVINEFDAEATAIDAHSLKEILKRSNGTSLSEILQQNNLSLADLLNGRENAASVLNTKNALEIDHKTATENDPLDTSVIEKDINEENAEKNCTTDVEAEYNKTKTIPDQHVEKDSTSVTIVPLLVDSVNRFERNHPLIEINNENPRLVSKRRFPGVIRRKHRMRPPLNSTLKVNINRQVLPLNARQLYPSRRNASKSREWEEIIPTTTNIPTEEINENNVTEVNPIFNSRDEIVMSGDEANNITTLSNTSINITQVDGENIDSTETPLTTTIKEIENLIPHVPETDSSTIKPVKNVSTLRRQAFNNRLKKKRLKQKNSTTESPQDDIMKNLFGMGDLVSSSEFIARTQTPSPPAKDTQTEITLEHFMPTEKQSKIENRFKSARISGRSSTTPETIEIQITTEESTKIEIEEIFNDTQTSAKLSRILMERNMTLSELVEHRERGSSHLHLADIFHNTSKEPNPSEPFLSKSFIEPISKETYPLRAILEANLHDPTAKATTSDSNVVEGNFVNIPVVMDFGSNVNENAENMGIMSLFRNFTNKEVNSTLNEDSAGGLYEISITDVNDHTHKKTPLDDTVRESRVLHDHNDDVVNWKEIFSILRINHKNHTEKAKELVHSKSNEKIMLEEDADGDGLIVLEDLQNHQNVDSKIGLISDEKFAVSSQDKIDTREHSPGNPENLHSNTRSVTVATASIAGLALILFLLTYAAYKWKQQRVRNNKKRSFCGERIPTPVFESRKGHKNNCSTRSISPMLSTSNIYTLNTLDSHNGKESPDYMWDSLRTPFQ